MIPAGMLATYLNKPLGSLTSDFYTLFPGGARDQRAQLRGRVLIVDDSIHTGSAYYKAKRKIGDEASNTYQFAAIYTSHAKWNDTLDYPAKVVPHPRMFAWNFMNHAFLRQACVDLDGVLCHDPPPGTDDDGERYRDWIVNATPKYIPRLRIKHIVTCRLEKHRDVTETWLHSQGVKYDHLTMMQYATKQDRIRAGQHVPYKAQAYQQTGAMIFIESSERQAKGIRNMTGKPVICVDTMECYQ
jgi:orotate phosphoribosyltransferase